jgi:uncharacterized protein (TIGR02284 family)
MSTQVFTSSAERSVLVSALNRCIEACIDAQRAYGAAAAMARDAILKTVFQQHADERERFAVELQRAVSALGAYPENQGSLGGAARRRFMDIERDLEPAHDDRRVLADLLREERAALETYDAALPEARVELLAPDARVMLREQRAAMQLAQSDLARRIAS